MVFYKSGPRTEGQVITKQLTCRGIYSKNLSICGDTPSPGPIWRVILFFFFLSVTFSKDISLLSLTRSSEFYSWLKWTEWIKCATYACFTWIYKCMLNEQHARSNSKGRCLAVKLFISCACWMKRFWFCVVHSSGLQAQGSCAHYNTHTCPSAHPL